MSPKVPGDPKGRVNELIQQFEDQAKAEGERAAPARKPGGPEIKEGHVANARAKLQAKGLFAADEVSPKGKKTLTAPGKYGGVETAATAGLKPPKATTKPTSSTAPPPPLPADIPKGTEFPEFNEGRVAAENAKFEAKGFVPANEVSPPQAPPLTAPEKNEGAKTTIPAPEPAAAPQQPLRPTPTKRLRPAIIAKGTQFGKRKLVNVPLGENEVGNVTIKHIKKYNGNEYIVCNTQAQGAYGKFRYALDMEGRRWAVKEFRSDKARSSKPETKTNTTSMDAIKAELATTHAVGASLTPKDVINIRGKVYAVMPLMAGEVFDIVHQIAPKDKQCVGRSVLRQMAEDLGQCHRRGYVHRDVKLRNALWNPDGKVSVADFGLTVKAPGRKERLLGLNGTSGYMGPEMYNNQGYDTKIDTWSLALSAADVHIPFYECPFSPSFSPSNLQDGQETQLFTEFDQWREGLITPEGLNTGLIKRDQSTQWDTYFNRLLEADPVLCEYMLSHMLVNDPAKRASMEEVTAFMNNVQNQMSPEETQAKLAFNQLRGDTQKTDALFKLLEEESLTFKPTKSPTEYLSKQAKQALTKAGQWARRLMPRWPR